MIGIEINGEFLDLAKDFTLTFDFLHPAFSDTVLGGAYSFPIDIPIKGKNASILNFVHQPEKYQPVYTFDCVVHFGSGTATGQLIIDRPGKKTTSGYINLGIRSLTVLDLKMNDAVGAAQVPPNDPANYVQWGDDIFLAPTQDGIIAVAKAATQTGTWENGFWFPTIQNPDFYGSANNDFSGFMNYWDRTAQKYVKNGTGGLGDPVNVNCLVPMFYLAYILRRIFILEGLAFDAESFADVPFNMALLCIYNNYALDNANAPNFAASVKMGAVLNMLASTGYVVPFDTVVSDPGSTFNPTNSPTPGYSYTVEGAITVIFAVTVQYRYFGSSGFGLPIMGMAFDLDGIYMSLPAGGWSSGIEGGPIGTVYNHTFWRQYTFSSGDIGKKVTLRATSDLPAKLFSCTMTATPTAGSGLNTLASSIHIGNHMPDMTVRDFLSKVRDTFNVSFVVDPFTQKVYVLPNSDCVNIQVAEDITRKCDEDDTATPNDLTVKSLDYDWPGDDSLTGSNFTIYDPKLDLGDYDQLSDAAAPAILGQTFRCRETNERYICYFNAITSSYEWQFLRDDYDPVLYDPLNSVDIKGGICPLFMRYVITDPIMGNFTSPMIRQQGSSPCFGLGVNISSPRFFWKADNLVYTLISPDYFPAATVNPLCNGIEMGMFGARFVSGEFLDYYKDWIEKILNGYALWEKDVWFDDNDLQRLQQHDVGQFWMRHINMVDAVIKRITVNVGDKIGVSHIEYLKKN